MEVLFFHFHIPGRVDWLCYFLVLLFVNEDVHPVYPVELAKELVPHSAGMFLRTLYNIQR